MRLAVLPLALLLTVACDRGEAAVQTQTQTETTTAAALRTEPVKAASYRPTVEMTGSLEPVAAVQLGFTVGGRIEKLHVSRGDVVREDEAVASLEDDIAQAQLAQARAGRTAAQAQKDVAESSWARLGKLGDALSGQDRSQAEAGVTAATAQLEQAEAAVRLAEANVRFHTLRAPIAGMITSAPDNKGLMVGPGAPIFVIEDLSALRLKGSVTDTGAWVTVGSTVVVDGHPAIVERVIPSLDPSTRRLPVEVRIDDPPPTLRSHAFARAVLTAETDVPAWDVSKNALVSKPEFGVFVSGTPPKFVPVTLLDEHDGRVVVAGELHDGDVVVLDPPHGYGE